MAIGLILAAAAAGGGAYLYAKSKKASTGTAAVAGVATGAGTALAVQLLPLLIALGFIALPAAGIYYLGKSRGERKALGPGRD